MGIVVISSITRTIKKDHKGHLDLKLWVWWILASMMGFAVGFALVMVVVEKVLYVDTSTLRLVSWAVRGAVVGVAQWLVLRRRLKVSAWWILACAIGFAVVGIVSRIARLEIGVPLVVFDNGPLGDPDGITWEIILIVGLIMSGVVGGIAQWLVLRKPLRGAGWWILASVTGLAVGAAVSMNVGTAVSYVANNLVPTTLDMNTYLAVGTVVYALVDAVAGAVIGVIYGAITGLILVWKFLPIEGGGGESNANNLPTGPNPAVR